MDDNTQVLINLSYLVPVVGNKWVFKIKYNLNGCISRYKARLVAKGFDQIQGIDYGETFSLVVKSSIIIVVLSMVVTNKWLIYQIDINNAFLSGYSTEEVYMQQPKDFVDPTRLTHVCKLHKALYGLK